MNENKSGFGIYPPAKEIESITVRDYGSKRTHVFVLLNDLIDYGDSPYEQVRTKDYREKYMCSDCEITVENKQEAEKRKHEECA